MITSNGINHKIGHSGYPLEYDFKNKKVLDVGSGHNPFMYANHCIEADPDGKYGHLKEKVKVKEGAEFFYQKIEDGTDFPDNYFDFVYCNHTIEHVEDVDKALKEISRIGKMGYIEVPSFFTELLMPDEGHINILWREGGSYCHCKKSKVSIPDWPMWSKSYYTDDILARRENVIQFLRNPELTYVRLLWVNRVQFTKKNFPIKW